MNERAAIAGAVAIGAAALGGLLLLSRHRDSFAPKVLGTKTVPGMLGLPSYVQIDVAPSDALVRFGREGESWSYRVAEPGGRIYLDRQSCDEYTRSLRVPYAYGRSPVAPKVEVWIDDVQRGSTAITSMPPPIVSPLTVHSGGPIRAFHPSGAMAQSLASGDPDRRSGIGFSPTHPIQPKERWIITVLQTPLQTQVGTDAKAEYATYVPRYSSVTPLKARVATAPLYYAEDVTAIRVRVRRTLHRTRSERVVIRGLRLVSRKGQTTLAWSGSRIPDSLGLDLRVPAGSQGFSDNGDRGAADHRDPSDSQGFSDNVDRSAADHRDPYLPISPTSPVERQNLSQQDPYVDNEVLMTIEAPDLNRLHIRSFGFGSARWWAKGNVSGVVDPKPFDLVLTITKQWDEDLGTFEATIPVESASDR